MPALVPIAEAARRLGVSPDTIKRRIRAGELVAVREPRPQGFRWVVQLDDGVAAGVQTDSMHPSAPVDATALAVAQAEVRRLEETVAILRHELDSRRNEAAALQMLLRETRALLPAAGSEPAPVRTAANTDEAPQHTRPGHIQGQSPPRLPLWQAIVRRLLGGR